MLHNASSQIPCLMQSGNIIIIKQITVHRTWTPFHPVLTDMYCLHMQSLLHTSIRFKPEKILTPCLNSYKYKHRIFCDEAVVPVCES